MKQPKSRSLCPTCQQRPVAINCYSGEKIYYRKQCDICLRQGRKLKPLIPYWARAGYRKKDRCDLCSWRAKYPDKQTTVFHVDGNLRNNSPFNLKTVCLNCRVELVHAKVNWKEVEIKPDF